jgi:UDP-N-acetyl-D-mannosaminuronate dehydrogenase
MVHLVVGYGEVGKAIHKILGDAFYIDLNDSNWDGEKIDVVHICVPYLYKRQFFRIIARYKKLKPKLIIVHSSVPVGTCDKLRVVHSPVRGVHPHLEKGIRTFPKYFGGKGSKVAAWIFSSAGLKTRILKNARTTEAIKLWDTTQYGRLIMMEKEIFEWCKKNKVNFEDVYIQANRDYNEGYVTLGRPEVVRPWLKHIPGPIGGHCVLPNARLLKVKL